jgi:hypothetical protein
MASYDAADGGLAVHDHLELGRKLHFAPRRMRSTTPTPPGDPCAPRSLKPDRGS